jgi:hypothetical protein
VGDRSLESKERDQKQETAAKAESATETKSKQQPEPGHADSGEGEEVSALVREKAARRSRAGPRRGNDGWPGRLDALPSFWPSSSGRRPKAPQYLGRRRRGGVLAARWNLIVPETLVTAAEPDER